MRQQNASEPEIPRRSVALRAASRHVRPAVVLLVSTIVDLYGAIARRGMLPRKYDLIVALARAMMVLGLAQGQMIRPTHVYEGLIKEMREYFNNTCIIILHANPNPLEDLMEGDRMLFLQRYLSSKYIRTTIMDFYTFKTQIGQSYHHIKRPLFVILNDHEDTRNEFMNNVINREIFETDRRHERLFTVMQQVTKWIAMGYPTWLIFFNNETELTNFFLGIYVPFDCKFMVAQSSDDGSEIITEVYRVDRERELRSNQFGTWDRRTGLKGPAHSLYIRRNDLFGQNIRVASVHDPPISLFQRNKQNEITRISGFFGEVILLLQEGLNCTFTYKEAKSWGICQPNGTCTGAVGMLMNNEVDFAATEFMMTSNRRGVLSFTTPIYTTKCRAYIKRPAIAKLKWEAYSAPFSASIWYTIVFFVVIMSGSIVLIQKLLALTSLHLQIDDRLPSRFTEILFYVLGAFCGQGLGHSTLHPVKIVHFVVHTTAVVILAAYSAALISFLTVNTFIMPFTTMEGLLKDGNYRFSVIGDSADFSFFQNTSDKTMKMLNEKVLMKETDLPRNYLEGLERVCKEDKYAFMVLDNMAAILQQKVNCKLEPLDVITQTTIAMALRPNSPYRGIIDTNILLLRDGGILQRLLQTQWTVQISRTRTMWKSVEVGDIMPLLMLMVAALLVSCLIYTVEYTAHKRVLKQMQSRKNKSRKLMMRM